MISIGYTIQDNGCWVCTSHRLNTSGYPSMKYRRKTITVARYMYIISKGDIAAGTVIRHTCDNKLCINPNHLLSGTHQDNVADRVKRDRSAYGTANGRHKLTEDEVRRIYIERDKLGSYFAELLNI